jgi:anti-sigma28 factor (negative regulator of flagellin synthesis)
MKINSLSAASSLAYNEFKSKDSFEKKNEVKIEESRVDIIKKEIQNGTYKVDLNKIAEAIAKTL